MNIQISTYQDSKNYSKAKDFKGFCGDCGLELPKSNLVGLCDDCYAQAMDDQPEGDNRDFEMDYADSLQSQEDSFGGVGEW